MDSWLINMAKLRAGGNQIHEVCSLSQALVSLQGLERVGDRTGAETSEAIRAAFRVLIRTGKLPTVRVQAW